MNSRNWKELRQKVWERDGGMCQWCWRPVHQSVASLDHIIPKSHGGTNAMDNLQIMHKKCNQEKADRPMPQYEVLVRRSDHPLPRAVPVVLALMDNPSADQLESGGVFADWKIHLGL